MQGWWICGKHAKHRTGFGARSEAFDEKGCQPRGRRGVARDRLADDLIFQDPIELTADCAGKQIVGDDPEVLQLRERRETVDSALDHGPFAVECQNLLGSCPSAAWPEAGSAATGENDGPEIDFQNVLLSDLYATRG